ncbi:MAG: hypothetical protein KIT16_19640 [Rhodospirillaceae bacterium]|nr:hypothetical protein [Rhodospirillaceae bacterium]
MMRRSAALLLLGAAGLAGTARAETGNLLSCTVHDSPEAGRLATCTGRIAPGRPEWRYVLRGRVPNIVTRIEIYESGRETPRQVLDGFELRPRLARGDTRDPGRADFVLQDANFDRFADLRIAIGPPDTEGTAYRWFLFDRESGKFAPTDLLDRLRDPKFNARRRLVLGAFRDERGRTGRIAFKWRDGKLEPVGASARAVDEYGRCTISHYIVRDGKFEKRRETACSRDDEGERD